MQEKLKDILKREKMTGKNLCERLGMTYLNYRRMTMTSKTSAPNWVNSFVVGYYLGKGEEIPMSIPKIEEKTVAEPKKKSGGWRDRLKNNQE